MRYSVFTLLRQAFNGHQGPEPAWRDATPMPRYDVIIIGAGAWSGNAGRNTPITRLNYLLVENSQFFEWSMRLWEGLEQELNCNATVSLRERPNLCHSDTQRDA